MTNFTFSFFDETEISKLINSKNGSVEEHVGSISKTFMGRKYNTQGPLGEGADARYDQDPLWRTDEFDCTTYVETIMAILLSNDIVEFKEKMNLIRYREGEISFVTRNHFTSADWIPRNIEAGFIRDITNDVFDSSKVREAQTTIDKKGWYRKMGESRLSLQDKTEDKYQLLESLRDEGEQFAPELAYVYYMPVDKIFKKNKKLKKGIFSHIKSGSVINIVRPDWNLTKYIGTNLNISHQGLAIRENGKLYFRHASPTGEGKVRQDLLEDYLRKYIGHKTVKGINVLEIVE
jgi:hypothetical protein